MSSFAKLAKRIVLANRTKKQFESSNGRTIRSSHLPASRPSLTPLSSTLTARIPQELFERIIYHLQDDPSALSVCSLVCRAWVPASRYHLFGRLLVRPLTVAHGNIRVNCSVPLRGVQHILYGTNDGIYISGRAPNIPPMPVLILAEPVSQIDVLEDHNLVIFLSGDRIMTVPLSILSTATPRDSASCTRVSSHATFFKIGMCSGRHLVCVVKAGLSTTCKLLQPLVSRPVATVPPNPRGFNLQPYKEFYVSEKVTSIHFLRTKLVAGTSRHDFEVIDVDSLVTQPLLDSSVIHPVNQFLPKCVAVFRIGAEVLLCYNGFCFKVNAQGVRIGGPMVNWRNNSIHTVALREPYLLGFGADHIEVRHIRTCTLVQTIPITYTLLSISPELCMIQAQDGRLLGLQFTD